MRYIKEVLIAILFLLPLSIFAEPATDNALRSYFAGTRTISAIDSLINVYPDDYRFKYEKAVLVINQGDITAGKKILDSLFLSGVQDEMLFQLLINVNIQVENLAQADFVLDSALSCFPNSSKILLEKGYRLLDKEKKIDAIDFFEQGIYYDPNYSDNYYPLIESYSLLDINLFAILHGEIFINSSSRDSLTLLASNKIYNTLKNAISSDFKNIKLTNREYDYAPNVVDTTNYDFEIASQQIMKHSLNTLNKKALNYNFDFICKLFEEFNNQWEKSIYSQKFKHPIYEYHKLLINNKLLKPYIYLIFSQGEPDNFKQYVLDNKTEFAKLVKFMSENPLQFTGCNIISRSFSY